MRLDPLEDLLGVVGRDEHRDGQVVAVEQAAGAFAVGALALNAVRRHAGDAERLEHRKDALFGFPGGDDANDLHGYGRHAR